MAHSFVSRSRVSGRASACQHSVCSSRYKTLEGKEAQRGGRGEMRTKRENKTKNETMTQTGFRMIRSRLPVQGSLANKKMPIPLGTFQDFRHRTTVGS